jgi:hypothetical protein
METDVNTDEVVEETTVEPESSSAKTYEPIEEDGFVSTVEFREVDSDETDNGGDTPEKQDKPDSEDKDSQGPVPYDRFQEVINQKNEERKAREALEQRIAKNEQQKPQGKKQEQPKSKYRYHNIMAMSDEDLMQELTDTPKQFLQKAFQDFAYEFYNDLQNEQRQQQEQYQQQTTQQRTLQTYQEFFKDKEDGISMLQDGTIEKFLQENPGHNPISAYQALAGDKHFESRLKAEVEKERNKLLKELKAAGRAAPVKSGTTARTYADTRPTPAKNKADLKQAMLKRLVSTQ